MSLDALLLGEPVLLDELPPRKKGGRPHGSRNDRTAGLTGPNFSREGAALYTGYSVATLKNLATHGGGPVYCQTKKRGKIIYRKAALDDWLSAGAKRSTSDQRAAA